jgi:hypothetical protein
MSNLYFTPTGVPATSSRGVSANVRSEVAGIEAGFDKLPTPTQLWGHSGNYAVAGGSTDAWTASIATAYLTSYVDGMQIRVKFGAANTVVAPTINLNTLGNKAIVAENGSALGVGDIAAGMIATLTYNSTSGKFHITATAVASAGSATTSAAAAASSATASAASAVASAASAAAAAASETAAEAAAIEAQTIISPVSVVSYTALRAYTGVATTLHVTGYLVSSAPSRIAGVFTRDDSDTTSADNGGTIIVASNGKRWKRVINSDYYFEWFGVTGDGVADDTAAMAAAISAAPAGATVCGNPALTFKFTNLSASKRLKLDFKGANLIVDPTPVGVTTGNPAILFTGSLGSSYGINAVTSYTNQITLTSAGDAANFAEGDYVLVQDQKVVNKWDSSGTAYTGRYEPNRVVSVSGANIKLEWPVEWLYDTTPVVQKMTMLNGPQVVNIGSITEVDPGGVFNGADIQTAPHLIQFKMCVSPVAEHIKGATAYQLHAVNFDKCIKPLLSDADADDALRPDTGGHGYLMRFYQCRNGVCSLSKGTRLRHVVDFVQSYDCVSMQNVAAYPLSVAYYEHGFGEKRCMSIDDSAFSGEANTFVNPWGIGNSEFAGAYDTRIIRPKMRGAWIAVIVGYRSENTEIIEPDFIFSSVGVGNSSRGVMIVSGAKNTAIRGGIMDLSRCTGSAADHPILSRYNVGLASPQTVSPDGIRIEGLRVLSGTLSDRVFAINNTIGDIYIWSNEIHHNGGSGIVVDINSAPDSIVVEDNWLFGNADKGIRTSTAASPYRVVNNRGSGTYATAFTDLASNAALIDVMNSSSTDQTFPNLRITGAAASVRSLHYQTSLVDRFIARVNSDAESGSNAGSNYEISRRADDGSVLGVAFKITRSTGAIDLEAGSDYTKPLRLGSNRLWVTAGVLYIKSGSDPTTSTDGTVVGTQT